MRFMLYNIIFTIATFIVPSAVDAQQQPASSNTGTGTNSSNADPATPQTNPATVPQNPATIPTGTSQPPNVTQPPSQPADPLGNTSQPSATQPNNDYHLTQPSTSPVGSQIGTQNTDQSATTPQPYNQQPGAMIPVERSQLPGTMIETLRDPLYEGWESSTIYYNRGTNEYNFDVGTGDEIKNYRFDRNGNPVQQSPPEDQR